MSSMLRFIRYAGQITAVDDIKRAAQKHFKQWGKHKVVFIKSKEPISKQEVADLCSDIPFTDIHCPVEKKKNAQHDFIYSKIELPTFNLAAEVISRARTGIEKEDNNYESVGFSKEWSIDEFRKKDKNRKTNIPPPPNKKTTTLVVRFQQKISPADIVNLFCDDFDYQPEIKVVHKRTENTSSEEHQHACIRFETQEEAMKVLEHLRKNKLHVSALWGKKNTVAGLAPSFQKNFLYNLKDPTLIIKGMESPELSIQPKEVRKLKDGSTHFTFESVEEARKAFDEMFADRNREYKILPTMTNHILEIETDRSPKKTVKNISPRPRDTVFFKRDKLNLIYAEFDSPKDASDALLLLQSSEKIASAKFADRSTLIRNDSTAEILTGVLHVPQSSSEVCYVRKTSSGEEEKDIVVLQNDLKNAFHGAEVEVQIIGKARGRKRGRVISTSFDNKKIVAQLKPNESNSERLILEPYVKRVGEWFPDIIVSSEILPEYFEFEKEDNHEDTVFFVNAEFDDQSKNLVGSKIVPRKIREGTVEESFSESFLFAVTDDNKRYIFHRGALVNDRVKFLSDDRRAQILEVLEREPITCVGIYDKAENELRPMNSQLNRVKIPKKETLIDKYVYKVNLTWEAGFRKEPTVEILENIGESNSVDSLVLGLLSEWGFDYSDIDSQGDIFTDLNQELDLDKENREDFSNELVFSIDPETAKDLDDALHLKQIDEDTYEVGVHIADVSFYVDKSSKIDEIAAERTTSIYLPDTVIPMLPKVLCEDLASLTPGELKRTFTAIFTMNRNGELVKPTRFSKGIINNRRKFSYEEAQKLLESTENAECSYYQNLSKLSDLAKNLREERMKNGATTIGTKSPKFIFDETSRMPISIYNETSFSTNKLVEEFMVHANSECAKFLMDRVDHPVIRFHDSLREEKCTELSRLLSAAIPEVAAKIDATMDGNSIRELMESAENLDSTTREALELMFIRCFTEARYGIFNKEEPNAQHFGLALEEYTHFTSPIRRFPDVLVHRQLNDAISESKTALYDLAELEKHLRRSNLKKYRNRKLQADLDRLFTWMLYKNQDDKGPVLVTGPIVNISEDSVEVYWSETGLVLECLFETVEKELFEPLEMSEDQGSIMVTWKETRDDEDDALETMPYHCLKSVSCELIIGETPDSLRGKLISPFV